MTVLIVEDDNMIQLAYKRMLSKHFDLVFVDRVEEAVAVLQADPGIGFVISDFNLVGSLTGADLLEWIKENRPQLIEERRFLFISGGTDASEIHTDAIVKPPKMADVMSYLKER